MTRPLLLMATTWFRHIDCVSLELGSVTRGRMPLHAASTSPLLTVQNRRSANQPGTDGYLPHVTPVVFVALPLSRYSLWNKDCTTPCLLAEQQKKLEMILQSNGINWATELKSALSWAVSVIFSSPKQSQRSLFFTQVKNPTEQRYPGNWSIKRDSIVKLTHHLKKKPQSCSCFLSSYKYNPKANPDFLVHLEQESLKAPGSHKSS